MVKVYDSMDCFVTMLAAFMRLNIPSLPGVDSAQFFQSIKRRNNRITSGLGYFSYALFCVLYHKSCDKLPLSTLVCSLFCSGCLAWFCPCHFNLAGGGMALRTWQMPPLRQFNERYRMRRGRQEQVVFRRCADGCDFRVRIRLNLNPAENFVVMGVIQ